MEQRFGENRIEMDSKQDEKTEAARTSVSWFYLLEQIREPSRDLFLIAQGAGPVCYVCSPPAPLRRAPMRGERDYYG